MDATPEEIATDYWANWYADNPKELEATVSDDPDFDIDEIKRLAASGEWEQI